MLRWLFISFCIATGAASQTDPSITAQRAARLLDAAAIALQDAEKSRDRVAALTQTIHAYEEGLVALRQGIRQAAIREAALKQVFEARSEQVSRLLGMLQVMEMSPAPLLLLHPAGPVGTARSGMILSELTPGIQAEAEQLRQQLEEMTLLRALQEGSAQTLRDGLAGVQSARTQLGRALSDRTDLPRRFSADAEAMGALLAGSETLQAFATGLTELPEGQQPVQLPDFTEAKGDLLLPVAGTLLRGFGEADAAGIERPGLLVATRPQALVTAPWAATIRYRGPLLDYGNVIILEPHQDYLLVFAGLGSVYGETGEIIEGGAPLGLMPGVAGEAGAILQATSNGAGAEQSESLYIELRQGTDPVDPTDWFTLNKE